MKGLACGVLLVCLVPALTVASPPTPGWHAEFSGAKPGNFLISGDPLTLTFSAPLTPDQQAQLHLELNNIDVSDMVEWRPEELAYKPVRTLKPGQHQLRLMYYGQDGSVAELGDWSFEVRYSQHVKQLTLEGNTELSAQQRLLEHNMNTGDDFNATGSSQWYGELVTDDLKIQGHTNLEYAHRASQSATGQHLDMTRLTLLAETDTTRVTAGDQQMGTSSLLMEGYQQRGMAGDLSLESINSDLRLFSMRGTRALGWRDGIGLEEADNRITGGRWQTYWSPGEHTQIQFSTTYLNGRVQGSSAGSWPPSSSTRVHDGHAWNAVMDGFFIDKTLRMRLEHATSSFDFDGRNFGFAATKDTAWSGLVTFAPEPAAGDMPLHWRVGAETQQVGAFYRSLGHANLPNDVDMRRIFLAAERDKWFLDTSFTLEEDNLDSNPLYPTTETQRWLAQLGYSDYDTATPGSLWATLGQPSYTLSIDRTRRRNLSTPSGYFPENLTTEGVHFNASFQQPKWDWSVDAGIEQLTDHTGLQPDTQLQHLGGQVGFEFSEHYHISAGLQNTRTHYRGSGEHTDQTLYNLAATAELIPERLSARVDLNLNHFNAEDDPFFAQHQVNRYVSGQLDWTLRKAKTNRSGVSLTLSYSGNQLKDRLWNNPTLNEQQLWLHLKTTLPSSYPGMQP